MGSVAQRASHSAKSSPLASVGWVSVCGCKGVSPCEPVAREGSRVRAVAVETDQMDAVVARMIVNAPPFRCRNKTPKGYHTNLGMGRNRLMVSAMWHDQQQRPMFTCGWMSICRLWQRGAATVTECSSVRIFKSDMATHK